MAEGLLDHDPGVVGQLGLGEAADDPAEEGRRRLQVEDRAQGGADLLRDTCVGVGFVEVARDVRESPGEASEDVLVQLLARGDDGVPCPLYEPVQVPVVRGYADDRTA